MVRAGVQELAPKEIRPKPRYAMMPCMLEAVEEGATISTFLMLES